MDLKLHNIIIDNCLIVKLIDFSISIDYNNTKLDEIKLPFKGTCFYIAPEVFTRKIINVKDFNKVDLYSLGIILYNLIFGCYPLGLTHEDNNYNAIYKKIMNSNPSAQLKAVCFIMERKTPCLILKDTSPLTSSI